MTVLASFLLIFPRFLEFTIIETCNEVSLNTSFCSCISTGVCYYDKDHRPGLLETYPWITYVVSTEIGLKILPSAALAFINWKLFKTGKIRFKSCICINRLSKIFRHKQFSWNLNNNDVSEDVDPTAQLIFFLSVEFIVTSIPMTVVKILVACGHDSSETIFKDFQTVSIVLEVFFAASDFYLFCWCHQAFREKVIIGPWPKLIIFFLKLNR